MASSSSETNNPIQLDFTPIDQIKQIYTTVSQGHASGITKSYAWREHQLKQLARLLQDNVSPIEEALAVDLGRPKLESHACELVGTRKEVLDALNNLKKWMKPQSVKTELAWLLARPKISHEPRGIVLIFGAWNYPVTLLLGPLVGAIAAGNSIILKPSENSPSTSSLLSKLIQKYLDPHNIRVINGGAEQSSTVLEMRFDHIFFTGNTSVGKIVALKAAETLTPTTLELGGKCPAVVLDDANLYLAAKRIIWAKTLNAGQTCIAPDYVLVSEQREQKLIETMKKVLKEFYPSDEHIDKSIQPDNVSTPNSRFSKIINQKHFQRLTGYLDQTKGEIVALNLNSAVQPEDPDWDTLRIPLTLIRNVKDDDILMQDELFGPLLPILTYNCDHEDVVQRLHQIDQSTPLAIYAFSQNEEKLEFIRRHTKSGQFVCNDLMIQYAIPGLPFGGVGTSGVGNYRGFHSFSTFSYERSLVNHPFWADFLLKVRYPPYTTFKLKAINALMGAGTVKGKSEPKPPALTDPQNFKRLFSSSSSSSSLRSSWIQRFGVEKLSLLLVLLFGFYFKKKQRSDSRQFSFIGLDQVFVLIKEFQSKAQSLIS